MARLILMFNKQVLKEIPLQKVGITIGRTKDNTISVDNLAVSSYHARIDKTGSDFILTDLQSTNGTFVNDKKIISHKLAHGDNILVGKHVLLFLTTDKGAITQPPQKIDMDKTMMLDTAKQKELLSKQPVAGKGSDGPTKLGVISFIDKSGLGDIELTKKLTKIGKADTSEVRLSGFFMPKTIATISRRPSGYSISYTGGMKKLRVNGKVIKDNVSLKDFDTIEIGSYRLQFIHKNVSNE